MRIAKSGTFAQITRRQLAASGMTVLLASSAAVAGEDPSPKTLWDVTYSMLESGIGPSAPSQTNGSSVCFNQVDPQVKAATIFLLAFYDTVRLQGSGVIVSDSAREGYNGVLTAGHVVKRELEVDGKTEVLSEVLAFDADGTYLGSMMPSLVLDPGTGDDIDAAPIEWAMNDIAVLRMEQFASEAVAVGWNDRGLPLSPIQSTFMQVATSTPSSSLFNPGVSGGPILNSANEIIGIATHVHHLDSGHVATTTPSYLRAMEASINEATEWLMDEIGDRAELLESGEAPELNTGGLLIGMPIAHQPILSELGVSGTSFAPAGDEQGTVAGFPGWDCQAAPVRVHALTDFPMKDTKDVSRAWVNAVELAESYADEIIIGELEILADEGDLIFTQVGDYSAAEDFGPG